MTTSTAPRERNPVGWLLFAVLALVLVGGAVAGGVLYARSDYRVAVLSPEGGSMVLRQFRVDLAVAGDTRPVEVQVLLGGQVVGTAEVPEAAWREPGSATVRGVSARIPADLSGWQELTVQAVGLVPREVRSEPVKVWVLSDAPPVETPREDALAVRKVLEKALPTAAVALDDARRSRGDAWTLDERYRAAREKVFEAAVPAAVGTALRDLFAALETEPAELVGLAADRVGAALAHAGLPLWLTLFETRYRDGTLPRSFLLSYELDPPMAFDVGGDPIPAYVARRIDDLNLRERLLGHRTTGLAQAVVLADRVANTAAELGACLHAGAAACVDRHLAPYGDLEVSDDLVETLLAGFRAEVDTAFPGLCGVDPDACVRAVERLVTRSVGHHEVRHVRDHRRGLRLSATLARRLDTLLETERGNLDLDRFEARVELERRAHRTLRGANAELSAYLAQLAEAEGTRRFVLLQLLAFASDPWFVGTDEHTTALAIFAALGREIGVLADPDSGLLSEHHLEAVVTALAALPAEDLARHAAAAYERELGDYRPALPR